jgi:hypothetical protein
MKAIFTDNFTDSRGRPACPASLEAGEIHYTTAAQIAAHGVCRKCRARMKENGQAILTGKIEQPADMNEHHHRLSLEQDHAGFDGTEMTQTADFDFDEIDRALGLVEAAPPDARQQAAEVLREIFQFCFAAPRKKFNGKHLKTAALRLAVIVSALRPDAFDQASHGQLAGRLGLCKAAASKACVAFEDKHQIKFARTRSESARQAMRAARLAQGAVGRHKPKADTRAARPAPARQKGSYQTTTPGS